jgi:hypothetical protein
MRRYYEFGKNVNYSGFEDIVFVLLRILKKKIIIASQQQKKTQKKNSRLSPSTYLRGRICRSDSKTQGDPRASVADLSADFVGLSAGFYFMDVNGCCVGVDYYFFGRRVARTQ